MIKEYDSKEPKVYDPKEFTAMHPKTSALLVYIAKLFAISLYLLWIGILLSIAFISVTALVTGIKWAIGVWFG